MNRNEKKRIKIKKRERKREKKKGKGKGKGKNKKIKKRGLKKIYWCFQVKQKQVSIVRFYNFVWLDGCPWELMAKWKGHDWVGKNG